MWPWPWYITKMWESKKTFVPITPQSLQLIWMESTAKTCWSYGPLAHCPTSIQGREPYFCDVVLKKEPLMLCFILTFTNRTLFKPGLMIEPTKLYIFYTSLDDLDLYWRLQLYEKSKTYVPTFSQISLPMWVKLNVLPQLVDVWKLMINLLGAGIAQLVVFGLPVHSVAGSILLWGHFPVEGIFPLELTWVQTPFPQKLFWMRV